MASAVFVLPGDQIDPSLIPSHPKKPLRLGPGLRHVPPNDLVPTLAGQLITDRPKNAIRVENSGGRVRTPSPRRPQSPSSGKWANRQCAVHPPSRRTRHRHRPPFRPRSLLRHALRLHHARDSPPALLRRRNEEDAPLTRRRRTRLRPRHSRKQAHGH